MAELLKPQRPPHHKVIQLLNKPTPPNPSHIVPPTGDQEFKPPQNLPSFSCFATVRRATKQERECPKELWHNGDPWDPSFYYQKEINFQNSILNFFRKKQEIWRQKQCIEIPFCSVSRDLVTKRQRQLCPQWESSCRGLLYPGRSILCQSVMFGTEVSELLLDKITSVCWPLSSCQLLSQASHASWL